jgi:hypothetical protein
MSAAAHRNHDLEPVTLGKALHGEAAARHDLAVPLERNAFSNEIQVRQELGAVEWLIELAALAVDGD